MKGHTTTWTHKAQASEGRLDELLCNLLTDLLSNQFALYVRQHISMQATVLFDEDEQNTTQESSH